MEGNSDLWKIEKTNFPFSQVAPKTQPKDELNFFCIGEDAMALMGLFYAENPYSIVPQYDHVMKTPKGDRIRINFFCDHYYSVTHFDPLSTQKSKKVAQLDAVFLAVLRDKSSLESLYLNTFPLTFKSTPTVTHQFAILHLIADQSDVVTKEQVNIAAEYIGATHIVTIDRSMRWRSSDQVEKVCEAIATEVPAKISYKDERIAERFYMLALVVYGDKKLNKKQTNLLDPNFVDPLGNNILHYAMNNADPEVFYYIADTFPELINKPNSDLISPIHKYIGRCSRTTDWDRVWKLPINFSKKNRNGFTCLSQIQNDPCSSGAFEALIKNEAAWNKARKHHTRKILLTNVVHRLLKEWDAPEKVEFFVKNGASIHHHNGKSLLNTAIKNDRVQAAIKLLELGAKIREEDIVACWDTHNEAMIRLMVYRPEMNMLSQDNLSHIARVTVEIGLTNILRLLVKKGAKISLKANESGRAVTANIIAQMHCNSIILPLKFQCVDVIYESISYSNRERNKVFTEEEAQVNWDHELKGYPEEIRDLFRQKELWRWALFLKDEKKQSQILKLFQATNSKLEEPKNEHYIELKYGSFKFCFSYDDTVQHIWVGDLKSNSPKHRMYYREFCETTGGGYHEWSFKREESNKEVLEQVMKACGWDLDDVYVFLHILHTAFLTDVDGISIERCFFTSFVYEFLSPPQWYADFALQTYGLTHPERPMNSYSDY